MCSRSRICSLCVGIPSRCAHSPLLPGGPIKVRRSNPFFMITRADPILSAGKSHSGCRDAAANTESHIQPPWDPMCVAPRRKAPISCAQVATTRPPEARMTSPVIQADSSDARNTASGAISLMRPSRPRGVLPASTAPGTPFKGSGSNIAFGLGMTGGDGVDTDLERRQLIPLEAPVTIATLSIRLLMFIFPSARNTS